MQLPSPPAYTFELAGRRALLVLRDVDVTPDVRVTQAELQVPDLRADLELTAGARFVNRRQAILSLALHLATPRRTDTLLLAGRDGAIGVRSWCATEAGPACVEALWRAVQRAPTRAGRWEWIAVELRAWGPLRTPSWLIARDALLDRLAGLAAATPIAARRPRAEGARVEFNVGATLDGVLLASGRKLAAASGARQALHAEVAAHGIVLRLDASQRSLLDADAQSAARSLDSVADCDALVLDQQSTEARRRLEALAPASPLAALRLAELLLCGGSPDELDAAVEVARSGALGMADAQRVVARADRIRGVPEQAPAGEGTSASAIAAIVAAFAPDRAPMDALALARSGAMALPDDPFAQECWAEIALRVSAVDQRVEALVARAALHPEPGPDLWLEVAAAEATGGAADRAEQALTIAIELGASGLGVSETRAAIAIAEGDYARALEHLEVAAAAVGPHDRARLHVRAGRVWLENLERPLDAIRSCEAALAAAPGDVDAVLLHAEALIAAQLPDQAVALLQRARKTRGPSSPGAIDAALADAYEAAGDHAQARELRGSTARGRANHPDGAIAGRITRLTAAVERQTTAQGRGRALSELGMALWGDAHDPTSAIDALRRAIDADAAQGERHEVLAALEAAARTGRDVPSLVRAYDLRLELATTAGERAAWLVLRADARRAATPHLARADLEVAVTLLDDPLPARRRLASLLAETGDRLAAERILDEAITAAAAHSWERAELLADRLALPGDAPILYLQEYASLRPGDAAVQLRLREALWAAGRSADALEALRRALAVQLGAAATLSLAELAALDRSSLPAADAEAALELVVDALKGWRFDASAQGVADNVCSALIANFGDDPAVLERAIEVAESSARHAMAANLLDALAELVLDPREADALRSRAVAARRALSVEVVASATRSAPASEPLRPAARAEADAAPFEAAMSAIDACLGDVDGDADAALDLIAVWLPRVNEPRFRRRLLVRRAHALLALGRVRDAGMPLRGALILDEGAADTAIEMAIAAHLRGEVDASSMLSTRAENAIAAGAPLDERAARRLAHLRALRSR